MAAAAVRVPKAETVDPEAQALAAVAQVAVELPVVAADVVAVPLVHSDAQVVLHARDVSRSVRSVMNTRQCRHQTSLVAFACQTVEARRFVLPEVLRFPTSLRRLMQMLRLSSRHSLILARW